MRKLLFIIGLIALVLASPLQAQNRLSKEEFRAKQKEFISQQASLTPEEAAKFFPIYYELQDKKSEINKEAWAKVKKGKDANTTETEYSKIVEDVIQARIAVDQLDLEYLKRYQTILSSKKIYLIQKAEMKFHREILKQFKNKK